MKFTQLILITFFFFATACQEKKSKESLTERPIDSLFKDYYTFKKRINPLEATKAGFNEYNDQLANYISTPYKKDLIDNYSQFLDELKKYDSTMVTPSQWMSMRVMAWDCNIKREGLTNAIATIASPMYDMPTFELFPLMQIQSLHLYFSQLANGNSLQPFHTIKDYDNWLKRVDAYLPFLDTCMARMNQGITRGVVLPAVLIKKMIPQLNEFTQTPVQKHLFFSPILQMPSDFQEDERKRLTDAYAEMISIKLIPKYQELQNYLINTSCLKEELRQALVRFPMVLKPSTTSFDTILLLR